MNQNPVVIFVDVESVTENCIYISFPNENERACICELPKKLEME